MKNLLFLALFSGVVFAQECSTNDCKMERPVKAKASLAACIDKLDASATEGSATSKELLTKLYKIAEVDSTAALKEKISASEKYAEIGCDVSKAMLEEMNAAFAVGKRPQPQSLSVRLARLDHGSAKGCEKSKAAIGALLKEYEIADAKALVAMVEEWETKAADGSAEYKAKLTALETKMPARKGSLSARMARLDEARLGTLVKEYEVADAKALVAMVEKWEKKAENGCASCTEKLDTLASKLSPTTATTTAAPAKSANPADDAKDSTDGGPCCGGGGKAKPEAKPETEAEPEAPTKQ